jgi:hypothetical protein
MKLVFLEDKLVVNILDVWQIEVRFRDEQRGLGGVHLGANSVFTQPESHEGRTFRTSDENTPSQTAFCASQSTR